MKSLIALVTLCVGICGCGGSSSMYSVPKVQRSFSVSQYSNNSPATTQTASASRQRSTRKTYTARNTRQTQTTQSQQTRRYNKDRAEATLKKIHAFPIAFAKHIASKFDGAKEGVSKISISKETVSKLKSIKTKISNFRMPNISFGRKEEDQ